MPLEDGPRLEFDWLGRPSGIGFTGCDEFGFRATYEGGQMAVGDVILNPSGCEGPERAVKEAFLEAFRAAETWSVVGYVLTLAGPGGQIALAREFPPIGDPGRELAEALRVGEWRILQAPGVLGLEFIDPVDFADRLMIAAGTCGFSGDVRFEAGGAIIISEVGWDTRGFGCSVDGRQALRPILEAVNTGALGPDESIVLSGPGMRGDPWALTFRTAPGHEEPEYPRC